MYSIPVSHDINRKHNRGNNGDINTTNTTPDRAAPTDPLHQAQEVTKKTSPKFTCLDTSSCQRSPDASFVSLQFIEIRDVKHLHSFKIGEKKC